MNKFRQLCLLLCCSFLFLSGFSPVVSKAYTALDGYPFVLDDGMIFDFATDGVRHYFTDITPSDTNTYFFDLGGNVYRGFTDLTFGSFEEGYTFPFHPDLYDYYLIGTFYVSGYTEYSFEPTEMYVIYNYGNGPYEEHLERLSNVNFYRYANSNIEGISFTGKLSLSGNSNVSRFLFTTSIGNTVLSGNMHFSASIVPVKKDAGQSEINASILEKLLEINNNLSEQSVALEEIGQLQQETIDIIKDQYASADSENFGVDNIVEELEEKAGALTFASDVLIDFLDLFNSNNEMSTTITFPSFTINVQGVDYEVWGEYEYNLSDLEENFSILLEAVRWGSTMLVYVALISYIGKCWDAMLGG